MPKIKKTFLQEHSLEPAQITWQNQTPVASQFSDAYYQDDALAEIDYIFVEGNNIKSAIKDAYTIAETGFGTGLNAAVVAKLVEPMEHIHGIEFISCEMHPMSVGQLEQAHSNWPELAPYLQEIRDQWPAILVGPHTLKVGKLHITLSLGPATLLEQLDFCADAWFLDGFTPSRNPEMWSRELFALVGGHSHARTTFATFTAASQVRKELQNVGFEVQKRSGFGKKREMMFGHFSRSNEPETSWHQFPHTEHTHVNIIGAGLAGATIAHKLAAQGIKVTVFAPETEAIPSSNPCALLMPQLSKAPNEIAYWQALGFASALRNLKELESREDIPSLQKLPATIYDSAKEHKTGVVDASKWQWQHHAHFVEKSLSLHSTYSVSLEELSKSLLNHDLIERKYDSVDRGTLTELCDSAPTIVATGTNSLIDGLEIVPVRGQMEQVAAQWPTDRIVQGDVHWVPESTSGRGWIGGSFDRHSLELDFRLEDQQKLVHAMTAVLGDSPWGSTGHWVQHRYTSPDHLPFVGPVPDPDFFRETYAKAHHPREAASLPAPQYKKNLYVALAYGAKGLLNAFLVAEIYAALFSNRCVPIWKDLRAMVHPARFIMRELRRGANS